MGIENGQTVITFPQVNPKRTLCAFKLIYVYFSPATIPLQFNLLRNNIFLSN